MFIGAFLRFYQLPNRLYFQLDEERDMHMVRRILIGHDIPLIGQHVPGGVFLGPLYIWVTALLSLPLNANPFLLGYLSSLLGIFCVILVYQTGKTFFNRNVAVISCLLWSFSLLVSFFNQIWWPLVFTPAVTLAAYLLLYKISQNPKQSIIPLGLVLILGIQSDPAIISLVITVFILLLIWKISAKKISTLFIFLTTSHLPLLIFDIRHNFQNLHGLFSLISSPFTAAGPQNLDFISPLVKIFRLLLNTSHDILFPARIADRAFIITWCPEYFQRQLSSLPLATAVITLILLLLGLYSFLPGFKKHRAGQIIAVHVFSSLIGIIAYQLFFPGYLHIWFLYVLFPAIIIILASGLTKLFSAAPFLALPFLTAILCLNLYKSLITPNSLSLGNKLSAVNYAITQLPSADSFEIQSYGKCFGCGGYRYLFVWKKFQPAKTYLDNSFQDWLYPREKNPRPVTAIVTFFDHEWLTQNVETNSRYQFLKQNSLANNRFGGIEVFVSSP